MPTCERGASAGTGAKAGAAAGVVVAALALLSGCTPRPAPTGAGTPRPTPTGTSVYDLGAGDCFDAELQTILEHVDTVACDAAHDFEVFASLLEPDGAFPGGEAIAADAQTRCRSAFEAFVGIAYPASALTIHYLAPTEADWGAGDRSVLCFLSDPAGPATGTAAQSAR